VNKNELKQNKEDSKIKCIKIGRPAYRIGKEKDFMSHKKKIKFCSTPIKNDIAQAYNVKYSEVSPSF